MNFDGVMIVFASGHVLDTFTGVVGLTIGEPPHFVTVGFDEGVYAPEVSREDFAELAEYMIQAWTEFRRSVLEGRDVTFNPPNSLMD